MFGKKCARKQQVKSLDVSADTYENISIVGAQPCAPQMITLNNRPLQSTIKSVDNAGEKFLCDNPNLQERRLFVESGRCRRGFLRKQTVRSTSF